MTSITCLGCGEVREYEGNVTVTKCPNCQHSSFIVSTPRPEDELIDKEAFLVGGHFHA